MSRESDERNARRAAQAAATTRRRRQVALGALVIGLLAIVVIVASSGGGGSSGSGSKAARSTAPGRTSTPARTGAQAPAAAVGSGAPGAHKAPHERVPILMYHVVNTPKPGTANPELWVPRADFAGQVSALAERGYHAVTLQQVYDAWHSGGLLPSKPIVFSFDDGYHSQFTNALPILRSRGWPGVLNLQVNLIKTDLKPPEVRAMMAAGWEVDAHTLSHPDLTTVGADQLQQEIAGSRTAIRSEFGVPVNFFCYPAGRFDDTVVQAVKAAGFLGATTTQPGLASPDQPPFALDRIRINGSDGVDGMLQSLGGAEAGTGSSGQAGE